MDREIVFKALTGSHNYNLNTKDSDKDYKIFTLPTFEDLYYGVEQTKSVIGTEVDFSCHDIRKLPNLFWKANLNFIEVLYSKEVECDWDKYPEIKELFGMRDNIVTMNLPYLYHACKGMHFEKMKLLTKGTSGTIHLVDKYGYDTKQALHAFRVLDFAEYFAWTQDFGFSLRYESPDFMLSIKNGRYTLDEFKEVAEIKFKKFSQISESHYLSQTPNEETKNRVNELIMGLIKRILVGERG